MNGCHHDGSVNDFLATEGSRGRERMRSQEESQSTVQSIPAFLRKYNRNRGKVMAEKPRKIRGEDIDEKITI